MWSPVVMYCMRHAVVMYCMRHAVDCCVCCPFSESVEEGKSESEESSQPYANGVTPASEPAGDSPAFVSHNSQDGGGGPGSNGFSLGGQYSTSQGSPSVQGARTTSVTSSSDNPTLPPPPQYPMYQQQPSPATPPISSHHHQQHLVNTTSSAQQQPTVTPHIYHHYGQSLSYFVIVKTE